MVSFGADIFCYGRENPIQTSSDIDIIHNAHQLIPGVSPLKWVAVFYAYLLSCPYLREQLLYFQNYIYATVHPHPLKRSLHPKRFSRGCFSPPKLLYLFWKLCISRPLLMEERSFNTSLTYRFPFPSLTFLCQQHLGRHNSVAGAAAKPSFGLGCVCVCACVCGERGQR